MPGRKRKRSSGSSFSSERLCELLEQFYRGRQLRLPFDDDAVAWNYLTAHQTIYDAAARLHPMPPSNLPNR
jgi:hypothetical protein